MDRLKGKTAIVTGGASGIGEAITRLFAEEGAHVYVFDIAGEENVAKIQKEVGNATFLHVDVTKEDDIAEAMRKVKEKEGKIDILVNNAGIAGANKPTHLLKEEEWDAVFEVDAKSFFLCTKHVLPYMEENGGGSIVNMASVYGSHGTRGDLSAYHAAKGAVLALTKQDAVTYGKKNIRVNAILPGAIETDLLRKFGDNVEGGFDSLRGYIAKRHPLGHLGEPKDIAYGALYLASDESKFVTGLSLYIDGGYTVW